MFTKELEATLDRAYEYAKEHKHQYITLEHVLLAMTHDRMAMDILKNCAVNIPRLREKLESFLEQFVPTSPQDNFFSEERDEETRKEIQQLMYTISVQRVLEIATRHAKSSGKKEVHTGNVLVAMFREPESYAVYFLAKQNLQRLDVVKYISHGITKQSKKKETEPAISTGSIEESQSEEDPLATCCTDLNAKAMEGRIDPLIGRATEVERIINILSRRRKNNPILVGDPGVGKTAVVEGLARKVVSEEVPSALSDLRIYALDMGFLLAGTKFRGQFEERLKGVVLAIKKQKNAVLFIDEIHTLVGAGATSGGSLDASNILKPSLANGEVTCIGSTTHQEYKTYFEKDRALSRRFQKLEINEPSVEDTVEILQGLQGYYEEYHGVEYQQEALQTIAQLSAKYIHERFLPDKAIDVMDEVGATRKLILDKGASRVITVADIEEIVAKVAKIPPKSMQTDEKPKLKNLASELKKHIYGQDEVLEKLATSIKLARSGLNEPDKPVGSFLFSGPTGVGKTEVARQLAKTLGIELMRYDMSEYMEKHTVSRLIGAPPGYVGFDQGGLLTDAVHRTPHCVLLLDEIEKAHPDLFNILLQVMDHATLTDNNGRKTDFRNVILIMTTNTGAREITSGSIGFHEMDRDISSLKAIEDTFSPEFRNRLTDVIQFRPLTSELMKNIVDKFIDELNERLQEKEIHLVLEESAREYLAEKGYDRHYGARPLRRVIENEITRVLSEDLVDEKLQPTQQVVVGLDSEKQQLRFDYQ